MRASVTFSWLHVTDLHQAQRELHLLLPRVRTAFERDLRELHDQAGPFDLVLFTGDLTQRGAAEEFAALDRTLLAIWNCQRELDLLLPRVQTAFERDLRELHDQ